MSNRCLASLGALALVIAFVAVVPVVGQTSTAPVKTKTTAAAKKSWIPRRTADGHPDLQGVWNYAVITPLERPSELAGKEVFTGAEAAEYEKLTLERRNEDRRDEDPSAAPRLINGAPASADVERAYNQVWWDYGTKIVGTKRTSLVIDPPDGRIPALTPEGQKRAAATAAAQERPAVGPEDRNLGERCIVRGNAGPPMLPTGYNNNFQLFQTPEYVTILNEQIHDARIVPMDGRSHVGGNIRQWLGDSRGRWEGDTLVVETTNFKDQTNFRQADANLKVVERFTRVDADTLLYDFTINDPTTWTRPWSGQIPMMKTQDNIYEYACHEGNYAVVGILSAARAIEKAAAEAAKKGSR
jgi:hypothetical protein